MDTIIGENGSGIGAIGIRTDADGRVEMKVIDTAIQGEPPFLRKAGLGGAAYLRHALESAVLERGGLWLPETIEKAMSLLARIDSEQIDKAVFEKHIYADDGKGGVERVNIVAWQGQSELGFTPKHVPSKNIHWSTFFEEWVDQFSDELSRPSLIELWKDQANKWVSDYLADKVTIGYAMSGLLGLQAYHERLFYVNSHRHNLFDTDSYYKIISARYTRTLCQVHNCENNDWNDRLLWPNLTELGRTILLLSSVGKLNEANEIAQRCKSIILNDSPFVSAVPWFGVCWGTQNPEIFERGKIGDMPPQIVSALRWILNNWKTDDTKSLSDQLIEIVGWRSDGIGQYDDEYIADFDDAFSYAVPYEIHAVNGARRKLGLAEVVINHDLLVLPSAKLPEAMIESLGYQNVAFKQLN